MARLIVVSYPTLISARKAAKELITLRLAACVSIVPQVESLYSWQGKLTKSQECLALIKTTATKCKAIEKFIIQRHPYKVPEFLVLPIAATTKAYGEWLRESIKKSPTPQKVRRGD